MGTVKEAAQSSAQDGKLALLFLIKEGPNNPGVWRRWLQDAPADRYSITVHAKHTDLVHAEQFKRNWWASLCAYARTRARACAPHTHTHTHTHPPSLPPSLSPSLTHITHAMRACTHTQTHTHSIPPIPTKWGSVSLVEAHLELLRAALRDPQNRCWPVQDAGLAHAVCRTTRRWRPVHPRGPLCVCLLKGRHAWQDVCSAVGRVSAHRFV